MNLSVQEYAGVCRNVQECATECKTGKSLQKHADIYMNLQRTVNLGILVNSLRLLNFGTLKIQGL